MSATKFRKLRRKSESVNYSNFIMDSRFVKSNMKMNMMLKQTLSRFLNTFLERWMRATYRRDEWFKSYFSFVIPEKRKSTVLE